VTEKETLLTKILAVTALFTCIALVYSCIDRSNVEQIKSIYSPQRNRIAIVKAEEYGNSFGPTYYTVTLLSPDGLVLKKIFEVDASSSLTPQAPEVTWQSEHKLTIRIFTKATDIPVQVKTFDNIKITYDMIQRK
jgi:hypothetical protein